MRKVNISVTNITFPKYFEMKGMDYPFAYNDTWITNGEFMIKRQLVKDSFKYCVPKEEAQKDCDAIVPQDLDSDWIRTDTIYDCGKLGYLRVFKCVESGKTVCFKDDYVIHFGIRIVKGASYSLASPFVTPNETVVLMACRNDHTDLN